MDVCFDIVADNATSGTSVALTASQVVPAMKVCSDIVADDSSFDNLALTSVALTSVALTSVALTSVALTSVALTWSPTILHLIKMAVTSAL